MSARSRIRSAVAAAFVSPRRQALARDVWALSRRLSGGRARIDYFHQADDPYSHLAVQMLGALGDRYDAEIRVWLVPPPEPAAAPESERLGALGLRDAAEVAQARALRFPSAARQPGPDLKALAEQALAGRLGRSGFSREATEIGEALWSGDAAALTRLATAVSADPVAALRTGEAERRRRGHYLGAMFCFEGEWFWGVDRLGLLEGRLAARGLDREPGAAPLAPALEPQLAPRSVGGDRGVIELWFSFRSPYSWLVFPRIRALAAHYGAELRLRFILPMVMRGLPVPPPKRNYITLDCKREADRLGLPFGRIVDPVGAGAERALAVLHHAIALGKGEDFAELGLRAAFADGIALAEDGGLVEVAARAGLTRDQVFEALADESWRTVAETNRQALFEAGLWGAPSFRFNGGPARWGQDRLWALEDEILRAG